MPPFPSRDGSPYPPLIYLLPSLPFLFSFFFLPFCLAPLSSILVKSAVRVVGAVW